DESSVCSTPLLLLKNLDGAELVFGPKTIKSILKSKSTFKAKALKGITINEPSSAPARGKSSSASKTNSAPAGKLKSVKMEDDPLLAIVIKELNELKLQISKKKSSYFRNKNAQQVPLNALQNRYKIQFKMNYDLCGQNNHLFENFYEVLFCKKCKRTKHRTSDHAEFMSSMNANQHHTGQGESSSRSRPSRPLVSFPSCIHCGYNDHHSNDCLNFHTCEICGSYDHDTHGHNRITSLRRGINPRNPQHVTKNCETCGSNVHTTSDHNDIEWFRKRETLQAKNAESFKASKNDSSNALRSKTPTKRSLMYLTVSRPDTQVSLISMYEIKQILRNLALLLLRELSDFSALEKYFRYLSVAKKASLVDKVAMFSAKTEDIATAGLALYLPHSSEYVAPPSIDVVRQWFPTIVYGEEVSAKGTLRKSLLPPRWSNKEGIWGLMNKPVVFKSPKTYSKAESVSQGINPGAQIGHKKPLTSSKQPFMSSKEAIKGGSSKAPVGSKTGHSKKRKESNSAMDSNLS
ncbi:hypothetical protein Tco_1028479, partial [Tanacetum coccineum]